MASHLNNSTATKPMQSQQQPAKGISRNVWDSMLDLDNDSTSSAACGKRHDLGDPAQDASSAAVKQQDEERQQSQDPQMRDADPEIQSELADESDDPGPLDRLLGTVKRASACDLVPPTVRDAIAAKLRSRLLSELEDGELAPPPEPLPMQANEILNLHRYPLTAAEDLAEMSVVLATTTTRRPPRPVIQIVLNPTTSQNASRTRIWVNRGKVLGPCSYMSHLYLPQDLVPPPPPFTSLPTIPRSITAATRPAQRSGPTDTTASLVRALVVAPATARLEAQTRYTYRLADAQGHHLQRSTNLVPSSTPVLHSVHFIDSQRTYYYTGTSDQQQNHSQYPPWHDGVQDYHYHGPGHSQAHFHPPGYYYGYYPPVHLGYYQHSSTYYLQGGPTHLTTPQFNARDNNAPSIHATMPLSDEMDMDCKPASAPVPHPPHIAASRPPTSHSASSTSSRMPPPTSPLPNPFQQSEKALGDLLANPPKPSVPLSLPSKPVLEKRSVPSNAFVGARAKVMPPWRAKGPAATLSAARDLPQNATVGVPVAQHGSKTVDGVAATMDVDQAPMALAKSKKRTITQSKDGAGGHGPQERQASPELRQEQAKKDSNLQVSGAEPGSAQSVIAVGLSAATPAARGKQVKRKRPTASPQNKVELEEGELDTRKLAKKKKRKAGAADANATPSKPSTRKGKGKVDAELTQVEGPDTLAAEPTSLCALPVPPAAWVARIRRRNAFFASNMKPVDVAKGDSLLLRLTLLKKLSLDSPALSNANVPVPPMPLSYSQQMAVIAAEIAQVASRDNDDSIAAETQLSNPIQEHPALAGAHADNAVQEQGNEPTAGAASAAARSSVLAVKAEARRRRNKAARLRAKQARDQARAAAAAAAVGESDLETTTTDAHDPEPTSPAVSQSTLTQVAAHLSIGGKGKSFPGSTPAAHHPSTGGKAFVPPSAAPADMSSGKKKRLPKHQRRKNWLYQKSITPDLTEELKELIITIAIKESKKKRTRNLLSVVPTLPDRAKLLAKGRTRFVDAVDATKRGGAFLRNLTMRKRSKDPDLTKKIEVMMYFASKRGKLDSLNWWRDWWLEDQVNRSMPHYDANAITVAAKLGKVDILEWWRRNQGVFPLKINYRAVAEASRQGHLHVLEWFYRYSRPSVPKSERVKMLYSAKAMDWASLEKRIDVLDWWLAKSKVEPKEDCLKLMYSPRAMGWASRKGHVDVLEWWANSGLKLKYATSALKWATENVHLDVLNWWKNKWQSAEYPQISTLKYTYYTYAKAGTGRPGAREWWSENATWWPFPKCNRRRLLRAPLRRKRRKKTRAISRSFRQIIAGVHPKYKFQLGRVVLKSDEERAETAARRAAAAAASGRASTLACHVAPLPVVSWTPGTAPHSSVGSAAQGHSPQATLGSSATAYAFDPILHSLPPFTCFSASGPLPFPQSHLTSPTSTWPTQHIEDDSNWQDVGELISPSDFLAALSSHDHATTSSMAAISFDPWPEVATTATQPTAPISSHTLDLESLPPVFSSMSAAAPPTGTAHQPLTLPAADHSASTLWGPTLSERIGSQQVTPNTASLWSAGVQHQPQLQQEPASSFAPLDPSNGMDWTSFPAAPPATDMDQSLLSMLQAPPLLQTGSAVVFTTAPALNSPSQTMAELDMLMQLALAQTGPMQNQPNANNTSAYVNGLGGFGDEWLQRFWSR